MSSEALDQVAAHRLFSAGCFNACWDLIDKEVRSREDEAAMLSLCHAALWHWTQREDCSDRNLSVGFWQVSRVYALLGEASMAKRFGERCLEVSREQPAFFLAYAYEACARAAKLGDDPEAAQRYLGLARESAARVEDIEQRALLEKDLGEVSRL